MTEPGRVLTPRTVNDHDSQGERCWICNVPGDHDGVPHAIATGDGLTRYDIIDYLTASTSHKWGAKRRTDHHAKQECVACGTYQGSPRSDQPCPMRREKP